MTPRPHPVIFSDAGINIGAPTLEKQRTITRCHPPVAVPGRIADDIGLGLHDTAAEDAFGQRPHHDLADQIAGERGRIDRQLRARERPMAILVAARFQGCPPFETALRASSG